jgi:AcrR family transcriptional regulator
MPRHATPRDEDRQRVAPADVPVEVQGEAGRSYGGLSAADRVAARRARFIEAGIEVFGTAGVRVATERGLCAAAGLTDRYFYESFDGVEALLRAVHATLSARLRDALMEGAIVSDAWAGDAAAIAAQAARGYGIWFDIVRDPRVCRILLIEVVGVSPALDAQYEATMAAFADLVVAPLDVALPGIQVPPQRRELIGRALQGAALHLAKAWMASGYAAPQEDVVQACVLIATGTMRALKAAAEVARGEGMA